MDVKSNNFISVDEDIKQITQDLLEESKTSQVITVLYFKDNSDSQPLVRYRRFESIPQMQQLNYLKVVTESKNTRPRELFKGDTFLVEYPVYQVKIRQSNLEKHLIKMGVQVTTSPPSYEKIARILTVLGVAIKIPEGDQSMVCEALFPKGKPIKRELQWEEVFEAIGDSEAKRVKEQWRKIYNAGREINTKVAAKTSIEEILLVKTQTIAVNPNYLSKS